MSTIIETETKKDDGKGRTFQAHLLAWIDAPNYFDHGHCTSANKTRPVWMAVATTSQAARPFSINMLRGTTAAQTGYYSSSHPPKWELVRAAKYRKHHRKAAGGVVTTFFIPELFALNPGMVDPDYIRFVMLPSTKWIESQSMPVEDAEALLFLAYLDRRTRFPFPQDVAFARRLLAACQAGGLASGSGGWSRNYQEHGFGNLGLRRGIGFNALHETFGEILADEIQTYHKAQVLV